MQQIENTTNEYSASSFIYGGEFSGQSDNEAQKNTILAKIIRVIVYVSAFFVPLWFMPFTYDLVDFNKQTLIMLLASFGLLLYLIEVVRQGTAKYRTSAIYWSFVVMLVAIFITTVFSVNSYLSIFGSGANRASSAFTWVAIVILFFLYQSVLPRGGDRLKKIVVISLGITVIFAFLQLLGYSILFGTSFSSTDFNTIGSVVSLAFFSAVILPIFFSGFAPSAKATVNKVLGSVRYLSVASIIGILIVAKNLSVWIVAGASLLAFISFASISKQSSQGQDGQKIGLKSFLLPIGILVLGIVLILADFKWDKVYNTLPLEIAPKHGVSYEIALSSISERLLGFGPENFSVAFDKYKSADVANGIFFRERFDSASSEISGSIAEGGIAHILGLTVVLGTFLWTLMCNMKRRFRGSISSAIIWASSFGAFVSLFFAPATISLLFVLMTLLVLGALQSKEQGKGDVHEKVIDLEQGSTYSFLGSLSFILALIFVLVAGYFTIRNFLSNNALASAVSDSDRTIAIEHYLESLDSNSRDTRIHEFLSRTIIAQAAEALEKGPNEGEEPQEFQARIQNLLFTATDIANRAADVRPSESYVWMNRGFIHQNLVSLIESQAESAISMYDEALTRNPLNPYAYYSIGATYFASAELKLSKGRSPSDPEVSRLLQEAEKNYKLAIAMYNNYGQALYNLGVVYERMGRIPQAIKQFEVLSTGDKQDPSLAFQLGLLYYRNGQKDNAINAWEKAVLLFPDYSNARWYLSLAYEERGELERALRQVEKIEPFNPKNPLVLERLDQLRAGVQIIPPAEVLDQDPL